VTEATAPDVPAPIVQRPIPPILSKLLALLAQHATLMTRVTPSLLDQMPDPAAKALLAAASKLGAFSPRDLLEVCAPEIRKAVAQAFLDEEFAQITDANKAFDDIIGKLTLPNDRAALLEQLKLAIARNEQQRIQEINARIQSLRISGQA
jgi:hypothetical protein